MRKFDLVVLKFSNSILFVIWYEMDKLFNFVCFFNRREKVCFWFWFRDFIQTNVLEIIYWNIEISFRSQL